MKVVTLDNIEWIESPNFYDGRTSDPQSIVGHWWGDPSTKPTMAGVVAHFQKSASEVSAHFVVSGDRIVQMVNMADTAWHARQANPYTIGIEIDPNTPGNTYETVGALVKFIRGYYGDLPLKKHSDYVNTACPGTIDLAKIDALSRGTYVAPAPTPAPAKPVYKVLKAGKQIGAYTVEKNAYTSFVSSGADTIMLDGKNVTAEVVTRATPAPVVVPVVVPAPVDPAKLDSIEQTTKENNAMLKTILSVVNAILDKLKTIFK